jgi:hypothetical protein
VQPTLWRRPRILAQVSQDLLDHRPHENRRDELDPSVSRRHERLLMAGICPWSSPRKCRLSDALLTSIAPEQFGRTGAVEPERVGDLIDTHTDVRAAGL